ncbi:MAG TPA: TonB-dependent receptor [Candidatus Acidoferrales bacterium]|nr:TonB-dependent receptor [Candidatus Acidoferrales bacterium]
MSLRLLNTVRPCRVSALRPLVGWAYPGARLLLFVALLLGTAQAAQAQQTGSAAVSGTVRSVDGKPIVGALISLRGNGPISVTRSDGAGRFSFAALAPGVYIIHVSAIGYATLSGRTVEVTGTEPASLALILPNAQVSSLTTIGSAMVNGHTTLSTAPAPMLDISAQPYAEHGVTRTSDILQDQLSTTVYPILGGGCNAPAVVALRGPDPSETLVDVDGHQANNGSTGDFDLSLLDPADLQSLQVVYGIAPSTLYGPNTLGGAVNVVTLEPTAQTHTLVRLTDGSCGTFGETASATGSADRFGYAVSYHRLDSSGQFPNGYEIPNDMGTGTSPVGDGMSATSTIEKLRYTFGRGGGFVGVTFRDQAVYRDLSATLSSVTPATSSAPSATSNFSGTSIQSTNVAYDLDAQVPLGPLNAGGSAATTATFRHQTSLVNQSVVGPGAQTSPYLYNDRDLIGDDTLEIDHPLPHGLLAIKGALTEESLGTDFVPGVIFADAVVRQLPATDRTTEEDAIADAPDPAATPAYARQQLGQTQRWVGLLYQDDPTPKLHYSFAGYYSNYSTFGTSRDPRFGFVWTPNADSALRLSMGSTFQSPQLPTFIVPPSLPAPVDGYSSIGNPHATAERATSYDVGYEHLFHLPRQLHVALDLYRTDLHNGVATYFSSTPCTTPPQQPPYNPATCLSYPVNVTQEVYQGLELHGDVVLWARTTLSASYDIDSVYTQSYPSSASDDVPLYEQSLGVPLHKIGLTLEHTTDRGLAYYVGMLYEGTYNEQNLPPFATLRAGVTWRLHDFDLGLYGSNLTDVYDFPLTQAGAGVPYGGLPAPVQTDAIPLAPRQITVSLSHQT